MFIDSYIYSDKTPLPFGVGINLLTQKSRRPGRQKQKEVRRERYYLGGSDSCHGGRGGFLHAFLRGLPVDRHHTGLRDTLEI